MEDLPPKLAKEWGRWCANPDFMFAKEFAQKKPEIQAYRTFNFPVQVITSDDDEISTEFNTQRFLSHISSTQPIEFKRIKAADAPKKSIGHMGYFRSSNQYIWQDILHHTNAFNIKRTIA